VTFPTQGRPLPPGSEGQVSRTDGIAGPRRRLYSSPVRPPDFEIEITEQGWLDPDLDDDPADLCSHGDIRLEIGGHMIAPGDGEHSYTISTSALALLRTLESDHSPEHPVADRLALHCGMLEMLSCPIGIDWAVTHLGERVRLDDVVSRDDVEGTVHFPGLAVEIAESEYRRHIVAFAEKAKEPFDAGSPKTPAGEIDEELYAEFWREYNGRLSSALAALR
jgi:hypothetical protein